MTKHDKNEKKQEKSEMKKKVLSLMLAGAMVLSMTACGSQNTDQGAAMTHLRKQSRATAPRQLRRILSQRSLKAHRLRYLQQQVWRML